jgi:transposase-like protein
MAPLCYRRHRFPPEIIQHAIWLYPRFTLSYRDVDSEMKSAADFAVKNLGAVWRMLPTRRYSAR